MEKTHNREAESGHSWTVREIIFVLWLGLALASLLPVASHLDANLPIFTVLWLAAPLAAVMRSGDARRVGFTALPWRQLAMMAGINLILLLLVMALFEPWSAAYGTLVREATANDPTFAWLRHYPSPQRWLLMFLYSATVTIFAEELFFRGWLLQWLQQRTTPWRAILVQAAVFTLPQALPALFLTPLQAVVWIGAYAFLGVGVVNGWAAARTGTIWPGAVAAPLMNLIVTLLVLS
jgi:membrane protease YdiL (CAAX protease family)